jgi:hypothetical protein
VKSSCPAADVLSFLEVDARERAGDLRANLDGGRCLDIAERADVHGHRFLYGPSSR